MPNSENADNAHLAHCTLGKLHSYQSGHDFMSQSKEDVSLSKETWRMFRILSEFVDGIETLSDIGPAVSVFGSSRSPSDDPFYKQAVECGRRLVEKEFAVITGGGPGIMEAANRGAFEAKGRSVGLNISPPHRAEAQSLPDARAGFSVFLYPQGHVRQNTLRDLSFFRVGSERWTSFSRA